MDSPTTTITEEGVMKFPTRPMLNDKLRNQKQMMLCSNYMKINFLPNESKVNQYSIKFEPELSSDNYSLRKKIL
jgi:hypothetical protein